MAQQSVVRNPFMLMMQPEVVLAAIEKSTRLGQLNRHMCRPLDRQGLSGDTVAVVEADDIEDGDDNLDAPH